MAKLGIAPVLGTGDHRFKSGYPDKYCASPREAPLAEVVQW